MSQLLAWDRLSISSVSLYSDMHAPYLYINLLIKQILFITEQRKN